jgi:Flp pilus assembly pilin Flp
MTGPADCLARTIRAVARFLADDGGATAIEYSIVASLISGAIIATVWSLSDTIQDTLYNKIANAMANP